MMQKGIKEWSWGGIWVLTMILAGCTGMWPRWFDSILPPPDRQFMVVVAPVVVVASIAHTSDIYTVDESISHDNELQLREQLVDEVALRAQRVLTEVLSKRSEFRVVPFAETRRLLSASAPVRKRWTDEELEEFGRSAGADVVVAARIDDYGRLGWRHWVYGWLGVASTHTVIVGAATAWNPLAVGAYLVYDLATDLPLWYGGAYVLGWAVRPVHVEADGFQVKPCRKKVWYDQEVTVVAGRKDLEAFPEEQRKRKEVQLQLNLDHALTTLARTAGETLRLKPCETT